MNKIAEIIEQALISYENRIINNKSKKYRTAELHAISNYTAELIDDYLRENSKS